MFIQCLVPIKQASLHWEIFFNKKIFYAVYIQDKNARFVIMRRENDILTIAHSCVRI